MAHFAQLDDNNTVTQVIVVNNEVITDTDGNEKEVLGIAFCQSLYGDNTKWLQTSYNGKFRGKFAGIGMKYDQSKDEFVVVIPEGE